MALSSNQSQSHFHTVCAFLYLLLSLFCTSETSRLPSPFCSGHWVVYPLICSIYPLLSSLKIISDYFGVRCSCLQYHIMLQFPFPKSGFLSQTCVTKTLHLPHFFSPQIHCLLKHYALTSWEWRFNLHGRMLTDWRGISLSLCDTFPQTHVLDILAQHSW